MQESKITLIDCDDYTCSILLNDIKSNLDADVSVIKNFLELPSLLMKISPDAVVFNYHSHQTDSLVLCDTIKLLSPQSSVIAIVSPGPILKSVRLWAEQTSSIDMIIEKPLSDERLLKAIKNLLSIKKSTRLLEKKAARLENLVPEDALSSIGSHSYDDANMFEATVLFTDIRRSTKMITEMAPRAYFEQLNELLSWQTGYVKKFEGSVIKYTGDGLMAIFKGMGRSYLGLRCGLEMANKSKNEEMKFGVGVAEGIVLAGFIGDSSDSGQRKQYDVIGATVHLASRLCGMANAGEVIATKDINHVAKLTTPKPRPIESVSIRGFDKQIDCVSFNLNASATESEYIL